MIKIAVLGGGFGGTRAALELSRLFRGTADIALIDRKNAHLFTPELYEVASLFGVAEDKFYGRLRHAVAIPYVEIFSGKGINFLQAEIAEVDLGAQKVRTAGDYELSYDYLILALGGEASDMGVEGVQEYAFPFKTLEDALMINSKFEELFREIKNGIRRAPAGIAVCGGGFTGVELAAELSCCVRKFAKKLDIADRAAIITIFEAAPHILSPVSDTERNIIRRRLTRLGVVLMENSRIEQVDGSSIKLSDGRTYEADMIIWTTGVEANRLTRRIRGLELSAKGKILVDGRLRSEIFPNVFAVGDAIEFMDADSQKPIPALAYLAVEQGKIAARNIYNAVKDREPETYSPAYGLWVAPVGGKFAVAHLWHGFILKGFAGWIIRELVNLKYFLSVLPFSKAVLLFFRENFIFTRND